MPGGRPPIFDSPEAMAEAIDEYFTKRKEDKLPATTQGLALALGFNSRQSLLNYEGYSDEFLDTIKKAKLRIEDDKVTGAMIGKYNPAVTIFDLKNNHDHKDKTEVDNQTTITNFSSMSTEDLKKVEQLISKGNGR